MMKRTMRKWFYFDGSDAKTAEAWLNRLGAEGWGRRAGGWRRWHGWCCGWGLAALAWLVLWLGAWLGWPGG